VTSRVRVRIGALVLDGLDPSVSRRGVGEAVARSLEAELSRQLTDSALPSALQTPRHVTMVRGPAVTLDGDVPAGVAGGRIARAVHAALGGGEGR
jgi:hypothetical protein